jgi:hypothetical protein
VSGERLPDLIDAERHVELRSRRAPIARRIFLALLTVFVAAALAGVFGQRPSSSQANGPAATLRVRSPTSLRGGLIYQARFDVAARRRLQAPKLVLDTGWVEGLTINSTEPQPSNEVTRNGRIVLGFDSLNAGERLTFWIQYQVNPTTVGHRDQGVELDDGTTPIARLERDTTVFP